MKLSDLQRLAREFPASADPSDIEWRTDFLRSQGLDPNNLYQELEMESRYVETHQDISNSNANVSLHSHSFYEILYCRNTCGAEYLVGTERYRLQKGDIIVVPPGVSHRPLLPDDMKDPYIRDVLWIRSEFVDMLFQQFPEVLSQTDIYSALLRTGGTRWEILGDYFHDGIMEMHSRAPGWEMALIGNTITLLSLLYRAFMDHTASHLKAEKPELLDRAMHYVELHLADKITLSDTARHLFVSESTISQTFRTKLGISFYRYVTQRRLIESKERIATSEPLESVAENVGFADYSSFYRAFKQEYGISPRQYRQHQT